MSKKPFGNHGATLGILGIALAMHAFGKWAGFDSPANSPIFLAIILIITAVVIFTILKDRKK